MKVKLINKLNNNKAYIINLLIPIFQNNNINAYLVGEAVRDLLLDREVRDIDISIEEDHQNVQLSFNGNYIRSIGDINGKEIGDIIEWIKRSKLCIGIKEDKDYLKKHLGEIKDDVKYKDRKL